MGGANYPYFLAFRSAEFWNTTGSTGREESFAADEVLTKHRLFLPVFLADKLTGQHAGGRVGFGRILAPDGRGQTM